MVANVLDNDIVVNEFDLLLRFYARFRTNTRRKSMNPSYPLAMD